MIDQKAVFDFAYLIVFLLIALLFGAKTVYVFLCRFIFFSQKPQTYFAWFPFAAFVFNLRTNEEMNIFNSHLCSNNKYRRKIQFSDQNSFKIILRFKDLWTVKSLS